MSWLNPFSWFEDDPPDPPDYAALANQQGQANIEATRLGARINRPNERTPFGSRTWTQGPNDRWTSTVALSPGQQRLYNSQLGTSQALADTSGAALSRVRSSMAEGFPVGDLPAVQAPSEEMRGRYADALMQRSERGFTRDEDAMRTRLANQGLDPGSEAFNREMQALTEGRSDARNQAYINAGNEMAQQYGLQASERGRATQEAAFLRDRPMSELNALRTGSQPQLPQFQQYGQQAAPVPAPVFAAGQAQYGANVGQWNAQQAQDDANQKGLFDLGKMVVNPYGQYY